MPNSLDGPTLSHLGPGGDVRMVDVSGKPATQREATASAAMTIRPDVLDAVLRGDLKKGDALATARVAGTLGAKRTGDLIPMCHPLPLDWVRIDFERTAPDALRILCTAKTTARTGVEMEALTGAAIAALTVYDMAKSADRSIVIGAVRLERKSGGKSGAFDRSAPS